MAVCLVGRRLLPQDWSLSAQFVAIYVVFRYRVSLLQQPISLFKWDLAKAVLSGRFQV
jgi:hypothetical protein